MHLACAKGQKPLAIVVTAGQRGDAPQFTAVMDAICVPRPGPGPGPGTQAAGAGAGGQAYSSKAIRAWLRRHHIAATIPRA